MVGPPTDPVPGVSLRVGLKRLRLAIILYACAGRCCGSAAGGSPDPAAGGRERPATVGGAETSCFTTTPTQRSEIPARTTLTARRRHRLSSSPGAAWPGAAG